MLEAIAAIERYLHRGKAAFEEDELLQGWFVRNLQILGEAARALPEDVRTLASDIEWARIIGMRNVLVHGYFDIDTEIVWNAASRDAPALSRVSSDCCGAWRGRRDGCRDCRRAAGRGGEAGCRDCQELEGAGVLNAALNMRPQSPLDKRSVCHAERPRA